MDSLVIFILIVIVIIGLKVVLKINKKQILKIAENDKLNKIVQKLPDNISICKDILKKLKNENVKIEEEENTNCFYFIATNKIILNKEKNYFVRIQTIAHECIHSIQDKKILWFNYIFSNLLNLFFIILIILEITGVIQNTILFTGIFLILILIQYSVRSTLEINAMTKAKYLACEYLKEQNIKEVKEIANKYEMLNKAGIKYTCFQLLSSKLFMVFIYLIISIILNLVK